jgi:Tol biopolymer transport system component
MAKSPGSLWKIYLVPAEGGSPEQLMPGERNESNPSWSPDGNSIVFGRAPWAEGGTAGTVAIQVLDLRTQQVSALSGSEGLYSPRWSSDGRYITALAADNTRLLLYDFKTQNWVELAHMPVNFHICSRDGKYVYFDSPFGDDPAFYRVRISDHKLERLVSWKDFRRANLFSGLALDDSPLVVRDAGTHEIYALDWDAP